MKDNRTETRQLEQNTAGRRGFFYTIFGGLLAGWVSGSLPRGPAASQVAGHSPTPDGSRIAMLEAEVARLTEQPGNASAIHPPGELEGESGERVVFHESELTVRHQEGVLLNLVAPSGQVGIRFYKDSISETRSIPIPGTWATSRPARIRPPTSFRCLAGSARSTSP